MNLARLILPNALTRHIIGSAKAANVNVAPDETALLHHTWYRTFDHSP